MPPEEQRERPTSDWIRSWSFLSAPEFLPYALIQYLLSDNESCAVAALEQQCLICCTVHNILNVIVEVAFKTITYAMNHAAEPLRAVSLRGFKVCVDQYHVKVFVVRQ